MCDANQEMDMERKSKRKKEEDFKSKIERQEVRPDRKSVGGLINKKK
jgi:hypothetical protein